MKKKYLFAGALIMAMGAFTASLVESEPPSGITQVEAQHPHAHILTYYFNQMDTNGDNIVTPAERNQMDSTMRLMSFSEMDSNGDGKLTKGEYFRAFSHHHGKDPGQSI